MINYYHQKQKHAHDIEVEAVCQILNKKMDSLPPDTRREFFHHFDPRLTNLYLVKKGLDNGKRYAMV